MPKRWRKYNVTHLLQLVRADVKFVDGVACQRQGNKEDRQEAA
jgi:hypothetical protein